MISATDDLQTILSRVATWPTDDRILLARKILETIGESSAKDTRGLSAEEVIELLNAPQPAPDDDECRRMLEEELMQKHLR